MLLTFGSVEMAGKWTVTKIFQSEIKKEKDVLLVTKPDRRLLSKVPDQEGVRTNTDRRRITGKKRADVIWLIILWPFNMFLPAKG